MTKNGFTLIELLIAIAIIGILASIAYPSYQDSVRKTRRAEAQVIMMEYASFAERVYTENNSYRGATIVLAGIQDTTFYSYAVAMTPAAPDPATTFTITATALAGQANDNCGDLSIENTGNTDPDIAGCWN